MLLMKMNSYKNKKVKNLINKKHNKNHFQIIKL